MELATAVQESTADVHRKPLNPLEIEVVIETVIGFIKDLEDLKTARLVSKKWNKAAWVVFNKRSTVHFYGADELRDAELEAEAVEQFSRFPTTTAPWMRFANFHIHNLRWLEFRGFREWMADYGNSMRTLRLGDFPTSESRGDYCLYGMHERQVLLILKNWCPNLLRFDLELSSTSEASDLTDGEAVAAGGGDSLESLSVKQSMEEMGSEEDIGNLCRVAIQLSPKLKKLSISSFEIETLDLLLEMNEEQQGYMRTRLEGLEKLDLSGQPMTLEHVRELDRYEFRGLKMLGIGVIGGPADPLELWFLLSQILGKVADSLSYLTFGDNSRIWVPHCVSIRFGNIPRMPQLKTFVNHDIKNWKMNFELLSRFPNLQSCSLLCPVCSTCDKTGERCRDGERILVADRLEVEPNTQLKTLILNCRGYVGYNVGAIVPFVPNLIKLHIRLEAWDHKQVLSNIIQLAPLIHLQRLWLKTNVDDRGYYDKEALNTSIAALPAIKSFAIEGLHYFYLKLEGTVPGLSDCNYNACYYASDFEGLFPLLVREFEMDPVEVKWLTEKFKTTDHLTFQMMG